MHRNLDTALFDQANTGRAAPRFPKIILLTALCCGLLWPVAAQAGQIYGQIRLNGASAPAGQPVSVSCGSQSVPGQTDNFGSYRVYVAATGSCTFSITIGGEVLTHPVLSYNNPARFNFRIQSAGSSYIIQQE